MTAEFTWNLEKASANFRKHGVAFEQAVFGFKNVFAIEFVDQREDYGEERFVLLGMSEGGLLVVVYVERGDRIRLISARHADRLEHDRYYRENSRR